MGNVRDQFLQIGPLLCCALPVLPHNFIQADKPVIDFIKQVFFLIDLRRGRCPVQHIVYGSTQPVRKQHQFSAQKGHEKDCTDEHQQDKQQAQPHDYRISGK